MPPTQRVTFDPYDDEHAGLDVVADVPLGNQPLDYYKRVAASMIANQIVQHIEPEFVETGNFEMLRYAVIVVRNAEDGRNHIQKDWLSLSFS